MPSLERVTIVCFAASYGVACLLELARLVQPRLILRVFSVLFGAAGLLAQVIYLFSQAPSLATPSGSMLFLSFVLAVFWLYGTLHRGNVAWGVFVLPLMLGLIGLALAMPQRTPVDGPAWADVRGVKFWGMTHGLLVFFAAVGICVGFLASVMYFVQMYRLRSKSPPGQGIQLLNLERLETMNRRAVLWAFPLLTLGLIVGLAVSVQSGEIVQGWRSPKILSAFGLWIVFAILVYLRYAAHVRGRRMALLTIVAFAVLLIALGTAHPFLDGGTP